MKYLKKLFLFVVALCCVNANTSALDASEAVKVVPLLKTTTTWDGQPIVWPQGRAEVTAMQVEVAPGAQTGWHSHSVPSFAVMLEGMLEVRLKDGRTKRLRSGDVLAEVVNTLHNGRNVGTVPVKLVVFYAGIEGQGHTIKAPLALGADREAYGCIGSAGYTWCAKERACVRPWELARQKGFSADAKHVQHYCSGTQNSH